MLYSNLNTSFYPRSYKICVESLQKHTLFNEISVCVL
nr:MAG TPA: hypothetical protein [Caudoviricetes sp.]